MRGGRRGASPDQRRFPPKGQFCTEDVDECLLQPNACQNGGTCTNRNGGYGCVCVNGWSGDDCSENIDDCAFASCTPGSTCIDRVASFSCMCPEGKAGTASRATELGIGAGVGGWRASRISASPTPMVCPSHHHVQGRRPQGGSSASVISSPSAVKFVFSLGTSGSQPNPLYLRFSS